MNHPLIYSIFRSDRARCLSVKIDRRGRVRLIIPRKFNIEKAREFLQSKEDWIQRSRARIFERQKEGNYNENLFSQTKEHFLAHKLAALKLATEKLQKWSQFYDIVPGKIAVKKMKSRWGSCSLGGNLNFNYKILFLYEDLADYLVVHEICHLMHMNHGPKFWQEVGRAIPDFKELRKILRMV